MGLDRISNLPGKVIRQILSHLSIRDAVRTSLLSRKWRYKWATLSYLVFDSRSMHVEADNVNKLVSTIDQVLLLHIGTIRTFALSNTLSVPLAHSAIDRWILHLSRRSISDIRLCNSTFQLYRVPSCLFSCPSLTHLELHSCSLKPPPSTFKGFSNLKSLRLEFVSLVDQDGFENLISNCPVLKRFILSTVFDVPHLHINSPNLQFLFVEGLYKSISFQGTSRLAEVTISKWFTKPSKYSKNQALRNSSNMFKFFVHLPHIRRLDFSNRFLKYLSFGMEPNYKLPKPCVDLDYLSINIHFDKREECLTASCLLNGAPNLEELRISVEHDQVEGNATGRKTKYFWEDDCRDCLFTKLKLVRIINVGDYRPDLDFVKFMLSKSPALEKMVVNARNSEDEVELVKKFSLFMPASHIAGIIWLAP